jgi:hypothetical protein
MYSYAVVLPYMDAMIMALKQVVANQLQKNKFSRRLGGAYSININLDKSKHVRTHGIMECRCFAPLSIVIIPLLLTNLHWSEPHSAVVSSSCPWLEAVDPTRSFGDYSSRHRSIKQPSYYINWSRQCLDRRDQEQQFRISSGATLHIAGGPEHVPIATQARPDSTYIRSTTDLAPGGRIRRTRLDRSRLDSRSQGHCWLMEFDY